MPRRKALTLEQALIHSIEIWSWLRDSGCDTKSEWAGWANHTEIRNDCFLCEFTARRKRTKSYVFLNDCPRYCPVAKELAVDYACEEKDTSYTCWHKAESAEDKKKYAGQFVAELEAMLVKLQATKEKGRG